MNTNILGDFQICISVPLREVASVGPAAPHTIFCRLVVVIAWFLVQLAINLMSSN